MSRFSLSSGQFRKQATVTAMLGAVGAVGAGLSALLLNKLVSTADFGVYLFAVSSVQIVTLFVKQGYDGGAMRFLPALSDEGRVRSVQSFRTMITRDTAAAASIGVACVAIWLALRSPEPMPVALLLLSAFAVLPNAFVGLDVGTLKGLGRVPLGAFFNQVSVPIFSAAAALIVWLAVGRTEVDAWVVYAIWICTLAAVAAPVRAIAAREVRRLEPNLHIDDEASGPDRRTWRATGRWLMLTQGTQRLLGLCDVIIVGVMLGAVEAAIFGVALRISRPVAIARAGIVQVAAPQIARSAESGNFDQVRRYTALAARMGAAAALAGVLVMWLFGRPVLGLFGTEYRDGLTLLVLLAVSEAVRGLLGPSSILLTMTGLERSAFVVTVASLALNVGVSVALVPSLGIEGAALGTISGIVFQGIARNIIAVRAIGVRSTVI